MAIINVHFLILICIRFISGAVKIDQALMLVEKRQV